MSWGEWIVAGFLFLSALINVKSIGEPRSPMTPGIAIGAIIVSTILVLLLVVSP